MLLGYPPRCHSSFPWEGSLPRKQSSFWGGHDVRLELCSQQHYILDVECSAPLCPSADGEEVGTKEVPTGAGTPDSGVDLAAFFGLFLSLSPEVCLVAGALAEESHLDSRWDTVSSLGSEATFIDCSKRYSLSLKSLDFQVWEEKEQQMEHLLGI